MDFRIADTFTDSLARLNGQEQKAAKVTVFDLQADPSSPGLQFHRIDRAKDPHFWSLRVNRDLRIIVHRTAGSILACYVGHHDKAYAWAERRRIEAHPRTGTIQIVEVRELVEEVAPAAAFEMAEAPTPAEAEPEQRQPFEKLSADALLSVGVPVDWVDTIRQASEDRFLDMANHLPPEAAEVLLEFAATGMLATPSVAVEAPAEAARALPEGAPEFDFSASPETQRRFRVVEDREELERALDYPWERWTVFLHPSQREIVDRTFSGPARVAGSAGTGKTVVALHRAARPAGDPDARLLLTTFSQPLANALEQKLKILVGPRSSVVPRVTVAPFRGIASELYQLAFGRKPQVATDEQVGRVLREAAEGAGAIEFTPRFLNSEWTHVVDAWQIDSAEAYANVPRLGRKNRLGSKQRERLWPVFAAARHLLGERRLKTWPQVFAEVTQHYAAREKPFTHIVVDEAQDLGVPELRFFAGIASPDADALFFAGDLGQRIFQQPISWRALGVDIRGRSQTLKVNYRTSHQIRQAADRLLPKSVRDVDGVVEDRSATVSVFNGPEPIVQVFGNVEAEASGVAAFIGQAVTDLLDPAEIGVFVRTRGQLSRARAAVKEAGQEAFELSEGSGGGGRVSIGTMHLAKGLEFRAVAVIACDDEVLPLAERVNAVADEVELDDVYETERQLFYVACTRARDRLFVSGVAPGSEFLGDLGATPRS